MKHISEDFVNSVIRVYYKQNQESIEDYNVSFDEFKGFFEDTFIKKCITLANDIFKHPGKYGKAVAKSLKKSNRTEKKKLCLTYASALINFNDKKDVTNEA